MAITLLQKVKSAQTANASTHTFVTTADIHVGEDIFIAMGRTALSTTTNGVTSITTSAGAGTFERCAVSCRTGVVDVSLARFRVTTLIPSGSTITWTGPSNSTKRGAIMQVVSGLSASAANATSGTTSQGQAGNVSGGSNGSSSTASSVTAATTVAACLVLGIVSEGGTTAYTPASGTTLIDEIRSSSGTADRGILLEYKIVAATGAQTISAGLDSSGSWAAAAAAFEIAAPSGPSFKEWNGSAWITLTPKEYNGSSWATVTPSEL